MAENIDLIKFSGDRTKKSLSELTNYNFNE